MEENGNKNRDLFNKMIKAGRRTYFVKVKEAKNNNKYVLITESKLVEKGNFEQVSIILFKDKVSEVAGALAEACSAVS